MNADTSLGHKMNLFVLWGLTLGQVSQQSVSTWKNGLQQQMHLKNGNVRVTPQLEVKAKEVPLTVAQTLEKDMEAWRQNSTWIDEKPVIEVPY